MLIIIFKTMDSNNYVKPYLFIIFYTYIYVSDTFISICHHSFSLDFVKLFLIGNINKKVLHVHEDE